mmetsp:Transcript_15658/g.46910  ORF Transcript_15658/g.46910 Transcript_15658/m.46910 type:complete len:238 (-) Transcript_15658:2027-2740(-)
MPSHSEGLAIGRLELLPCAVRLVLEENCDVLLEPAQISLRQLCFRGGLTRGLGVHIGREGGGEGECVFRRFHGALKGEHVAIHDTKILHTRNEGIGQNHPTPSEHLQEDVLHRDTEYLDDAIDIGRWKIRTSPEIDFLMVHRDQCNRVLPLSFLIHSKMGNHMHKDGRSLKNPIIIKTPERTIIEGHLLSRSENPKDLIGNLEIKTESFVEIANRLSAIHFQYFGFTAVRKVRQNFS